MQRDLTHIRNLCITGGGIEGIAILGSLTYLEDIGVLHQIENFAGSSVGAIIAALLAIGYEPTELSDFVLHNDLTSLVLGNSCILRKIYNFLFHFGVYDGNALTSMIERLFYKKIKKYDLTFRELKDGYNKNLTATGTSLNSRDTIFFNNVRTPDMSIIQALRISASFPLLFTSVPYENDEFVDGGMLDNFPLYYFDSADNFYKDKLSLLETRPVQNKTLGIYLLTTDEKETRKFYYGYNPVANLSQYLMAVLKSLLLKIQINSIRNNFWDRVIGITLPTSISALSFSVNDLQKHSMIKSGYDAAANFCTK